MHAHGEPSGEFHGTDRNFDVPEVSCKTSMHAHGEPSGEFHGTDRNVIQSYKS
jgi:hypothetical protein